jgi:hypothetical protein
MVDWGLILSSFKAKLKAGSVSLILENKRRLVRVEEAENEYPEY